METDLQIVSKSFVPNLGSEESVSEEPIDEDWITRFFSMAEDVSSEDMQLFWGKILAGKIKQPNSFSLRTLEVLRNISTEEAKIFEKISHYCVRWNQSIFIKYSEKYFDNKGLYYNDFMLLKELGIIHDVDSSVINIGTENGFIYGNYFILIKNGERKGLDIIDFTKMLNDEFKITEYTTIGKQLLSLVNPVYDESYFKMFACSILNDVNGNRLGYRTAQYGNLIKIDENGIIKYGNLVDVPIE